MQISLVFMQIIFAAQIINLTLPRQIIKLILKILRSVKFILANRFISTTYE